MSYTDGGGEDNRLLESLCRSGEVEVAFSTQAATTKCLSEELITAFGRCFQFLFSLKFPLPNVGREKQGSFHVHNPKFVAPPSFVLLSRRVLDATSHPIEDFSQ